MSERVRKVVVVGRDAAAWLSALTLQLSFGRADPPLAVELVELPSRLREQDVFLTLPAQQAFHRLLGLDENRLLRTCAGLYSLGQRFSNWSGADEPFIHAYDSHGAAFGHVEFFQHWLKARARGLPVPLEDFSLGAAAAKQGRFVIFNESTEGFSKASYGYNLSAIGYLRALGKVALGAGLEHRVGELQSVDVESGRVRSVALRDGRTVTGDLFVDASGVEGSLIGRLEEPGNFSSWRRWLPCDRLMVASGPVLKPIPAFSQVSAFRAGWFGIFPLMDRSALIASYASDRIEDAEVMHTMSSLSGIRISGDAVADTIEPGARRQQWIGNCVALGDAAVAVEPLDAVQLHLLQTGLSWLVSLFPVDREAMPEASVYNAKMEAHATGVRDFQAAHYKLNRRFGEAFWDAAREQPASPTLERKLRLFAARGVVAMQEHETFQEENWTSIFAGHRLLPTAWDPQVDKVPEQEQIENFRRMLKFIAAEVQAMPSLQAHLDLNSPQPTSDYIF